MLSGKLISKTIRDGYQEARLFLIEANGDKYEVHCRVNDDGSGIITDQSPGETIDYLNQRHTPQVVWMLCKSVVLEAPDV